MEKLQGKTSQDDSSDYHRLSARKRRMIEATYTLCLGTNEAISMWKAYVKVPTFSLSRVSDGMVWLDADVIYYNCDFNIPHTVPHFWFGSDS